MVATEPTNFFNFECCGQATTGSGLKSGEQNKTKSPSSRPSRASRTSRTDEARQDEHECGDERYDEQYEDQYDEHYDEIIDQRYEGDDRNHCPDENRNDQHNDDFWDDIEGNTQEPPRVISFTTTEEAMLEFVPLGELESSSRLGSKRALAVNTARNPQPPRFSEPLGLVSYDGKKETIQNASTKTFSALGGLLRWLSPSRARQERSSEIDRSTPTEENWGPTASQQPYENFTHQIYRAPDAVHGNYMYLQDLPPQARQMHDGTPLSYMPANYVHTRDIPPNAAQMRNAAPPAGMGPTHVAQQPYHVGNTMPVGNVQEGDFPPRTSRMQNGMPHEYMSMNAMQTISPRVQVTSGMYVSTSTQLDATPSPVPDGMRQSNLQQQGYMADTLPLNYVQSPSMLQQQSPRIANDVRLRDMNNGDVAYQTYGPAPFDHGFHATEHQTMHPGALRPGSGRPPSSPRTPGGVRSSDGSVPTRPSSRSRSSGNRSTSSGSYSRERSLSKRPDDPSAFATSTSVTSRPSTASRPRSFTFSRFKARADLPSNDPVKVYTPEPVQGESEDRDETLQYPLGYAYQSDKHETLMGENPNLVIRESRSWGTFADDEAHLTFQREYSGPNVRNEKETSAYSKSTATKRSHPTREGNNIPKSPHARPARASRETRAGLSDTEANPMQPIRPVSQERGETSHSRPSMVSNPMPPTRRSVSQDERVDESHGRSNSAPKPVPPTRRSVSQDERVDESHGRSNSAPKPVPTTRRSVSQDERVDESHGHSNSAPKPVPPTRRSVSRDDRVDESHGRSNSAPKPVRRSVSRERVDESRVRSSTTPKPVPSSTQRPLSRELVDGSRGRSSSAPKPVPPTRSSVSRERVDRSGGHKTAAGRPLATQRPISQERGEGNHGFHPDSSAAQRYHNQSASHTERVRGSRYTEMVRGYPSEGGKGEGRENPERSQGRNSRTSHDQRNSPPAAADVQGHSRPHHNSVSLNRGKTYTARPSAYHKEDNLNRGYVSDSGKGLRSMRSQSVDRFGYRENEMNRGYSSDGGKYIRGHRVDRYRDYHA